MIRIGVDVGGTFTDVVAIDAATRKLVAFIKVPTTHDAPEGVAAGIVSGIRRLLTEHGIAPGDVAFIAHSTTQATNSLLEGDVADVGVIGLTTRLGWLAKGQMQFKPFELAPKVPFQPRFAFARSGASANAQVDALAAAGAQSIAVSEAFSVDRPALEEASVAYARSRNLYATAGHEVSSMYGLRARTRTAALNAAILPKMVRTAEMTAKAVTDAAIASPLMIMRSDGGVMDVREIERRPILTLLSGPAAGVAGALLHENVTDGIFIEVGGTSADCSAIRAGMPQMRPARVGGHRTMLRTIDVRTLAIAGGSMVRLGAGEIVDVGPRSAHIAGLHYAAFTDAALVQGARVERIQPTRHDPDDYAALIAADGTRIAVTPTCAANVLGYVPETAFAYGDAQAARAGCEILGREIGVDAEAFARRLLDIATDKVLAAVDELIADYELDPVTLVIVGGGGGAAALVPYAAERSKHQFRLARNAEVISPIGVALALVRDVVERTIVHPTPQDIVRLRQEAQDRVIAAGAAPETIDVAVEIDAQRNLVRATASGASALSKDAKQSERTPAEQLAIAADLMRADPAAVERIEATGALTVFVAARGKIRDVRVLDTTGVARVSLRDALITQTDAGHACEVLGQTLEDQTSFGDVGRALPTIYVIHGARIANLSGLASAAQVVALAREELNAREPASPVTILTTRNRA